MYTLNIYTLENIYTYIRTIQYVRTTLNKTYTTIYTHTIYIVIY